MPKIAYSDLSPTTACRRLRIGALSRLCWTQLTIGVMSTPCTARVDGLGRDGEMSDVANAG